MRSPLVSLCLILGLAILPSLSIAEEVPEGPPEGYSVHGAHALLVDEEPTTPEGAVPQDARRTRRSVTPTTGDMIVLGYVQNNETRWGFHWHTLTHLALAFTNFDSNGDIMNPGSITGRSVIYRPGGMADRHGVKVLMTLRNDGFTLSVLEDVMLDPARRANLIGQIATLVNDPTDNIAGVNLDFEPAWSNPAVRDAIYQFIADLRDALDEGKSISWYIEPGFSTVRYGNIGSVAEYVDFFNYSCYPWAGSWSTTATSVVNRQGYAITGTNRLNRFFEEGMPPEKTVLTLGSYGVRWNTDIPSLNPADAYGSSINSQIGSWGFGDAKFETTLSNNAKQRFFHTPSFSPYYASQISGNSFRTVVYEDEESIAIKARDALSWPGSEATGARLAGIGFWSLRWMSPNSFGGFQSFDMEAGSSTPKFRTYPHLYQMTQEILAPPGTNEYIIEKWEYFDSVLLGSFLGSTYQNVWDRWRNPDEGPDSVGLVSASRDIVPVPSGPDQPHNSEYCLELDFQFSATANNRFFYRWEILGDATETTVADRNAVNSVLPQAAIVKADLHTPVALPNATIRFVLMDANGELELGPQESLNTTGWRTMEWDLTTGATAGYTTSFTQYNSGNGVIDTTPGERDLAIVGFLVEGNGAADSGLIHLDELRWSPTVTGEQYLINEFAYSSNANEFVEIHGPPGPIPAGMELRFHQGSTGDVYKTVDISGHTIPSSGLLAFGTPGSGATVTTGFSDTVNDIFNVAPNGIQIYNALTEEQHDSLIYRAFGGIGLLGTAASNGVSSNGYPWLGEIPSAGYSFGRYPDGHNTGINADDFSVMPLSVGQPNGAEIALPVTYNFDTMPAEAFLAYNWAQAGAVASGVGASPSGGNVLRVADSIGGNIGFIGDSSLGADGQGIEVTGEIYIPATGEPAQAIGVGFAGTQGSTFFSFFPNGNGYENGYWLIYQNTGSVEINNGLGNHAEEFKFVKAQNNNMQPAQVVELGSATRATTGAPNGGWTTFRLLIDPTEDSLVAEINGATVYDDVIPAGGRTSGAVQVGHRETHGTGTSGVEGAWVDNIQISSPGGQVSTDPDIDVDPLVRSFGNVEVGTTSAAQSVTIENTGDGDDLVVNLAFAGAGAGAYTIVGGNQSPYTITQNNDVVIQIEFSPGSEASFPATLEVDHNAPGASSPIEVTLSGTGIAADIDVAPTALNFGIVDVGEDDTLLVTIENNGSGPDLNLQSFSITGSGAGAFSIVSGDVAPLPLGQGEDHVLTIEFAPTDDIVYNATLEIAHDVAGVPSPIEVSLTGEGEEDSATGIEGWILYDNR